MLYSLANLDAAALEEVQKIERSLGKRVLALKRIPVEYNALSPDELGQLTEAEKRLGLTLLVVK